MNYYNPNFYQNYQYQNPQQFMNPVQQPPQQQIGLNGKIVDSEDMVKAMEVPIGGFGIFPKADLSEVYIKNWNSNGTTSLIRYKPYVQEVPTTDNQENMSAIMARLDALENKIDEALTNKQPKKKESALNVY